MDAIAYFNIILRLGFWFLLTNDFSVANIVIGVIIALLLPQKSGQVKRLAVGVVAGRYCYSPGIYRSDRNYAFSP